MCLRINVLSRFIFVFLACLSCKAQLPILPTTLLSSSSIPDPTTVPGLALWWVSSDLSVGPKVSDWVDRIQGKHWTNGNSAKQPTNSATGVYFDGSVTVLTNDGSFKLTTASGLFTIWAIVKPVQDGDGGTQRAFLTQPNNVQQAGKGLYWFNHTFTDVTGGTVYFKGVTNNYQDYIFQSDVTVPHTWYTNNAATATGINIQVGGDVTFFNLGQNPTVNNGWFYVAEIGLYTNDIGANSTYRATLHTYATNKYSYAP